MKKTLRWASFIVGFALGFQLSYSLIEFSGNPIDFIGIRLSGDFAKYAVLAGIGITVGLIFLIIIPRITSAFGSMSKDWVKNLRGISLTQLLANVIGLIISLILASLIYNPINMLGIPEWIKFILMIVIYIGFGYAGILIVNQKWNDLDGLLKSKLIKEKPAEDHSKTRMPKRQAVVPKIFDTSVIIDGRIFDILKTGFLEGPVVIPAFVLDELQFVADSSDTIKRNRGRRGLDVLNKIRKELNIEVIVSDKNYPDLTEVDVKLLKLALDIKGKVVTNDYNLNKIAELQGVSVLNTNDLSNAVKSVVLPGEEMSVYVLKEGKEHNQGIAYLDDGTMIVVEGGRNLINKSVNVVVTSVLQTSAGRMIFARPV